MTTKLEFLADHSIFADLDDAGMETDLSWQVVPADQVDIGQIIAECGL